MTEPTSTTDLGRLRILSSAAGIRVSPLQLGAMSIGDAWAGMMGPIDKDSVFKLLDAFYECCGNFIDTANSYQWIQGRNNRDTLVLAAKFSMDYRSHFLGKGSQVANFAGNSRRAMHAGIRDSLKKLQTDYIGIYYVHYWGFNTAIKELMDALHVLGDTSAWIVAAVNTYAIDHGKMPFSIYQGRWNLLNKVFERDIIPMARHFGMALASCVSNLYVPSLTRLLHL